LEFSSPALLCVTVSNRGSSVDVQGFWFSLIGASLFSISALADGANLVEGDWATPCTPLPRRHSVLVSSTFGQKDVHTNIELFADQACEILNLTITYAETYRMGDPYGEGMAFDHVASVVSLEIQDRDALAYYQAHRSCGISDWALGQPRDVSGRFCDPFQMPSAGKLVEDIVSVAREEMVFGLFPRTAESGSPRPERLDPFFIFRKLRR
jgi:hypothetical protein